MIVMVVEIIMRTVMVVIPTMGMKSNYTLEIWIMVSEEEQNC
jgi:hypothetical protein